LQNYQNILEIDILHLYILHCSYHEQNKHFDLSKVFQSFLDVGIVFHPNSTDHYIHMCQDLYKFLLMNKQLHFLLVLRNKLVFDRMIQSIVLNQNICRPLIIKCKLTTKNVWSWSWCSYIWTHLYSSSWMINYLGYPIRSIWVNQLKLLK
jgi:hypothetical protein